MTPHSGAASAPYAGVRTDRHPSCRPARGNCREAPSRRKSEFPEKLAPAARGTSFEMWPQMVTGRRLRASTMVVVLSCGWPAAISSDPRVAVPATAPAVAAPRAWCAPLLPGPRSAERNAAGTLPCVVPGRGACNGGCRRQRCIRVACCIRLACATGPAVCASIPEPRAERLQAAGGGAHRDASLRHCPRCAAARGGQRCAA